MSSLKKVDAGAMSAQLRGFNLRTVNSGYYEYPFAGRDALSILFAATLIVMGALI